MKSKITAALLCFFLGFFGAHKFYLNKPGLGTVYLLTALFGWIILFIPTIILSVVVLIDFIIILTKDEKDLQPNSNSNTVHVSPSNAIESINQLKALHEKGTITDAEFEEKKAKLLNQI